MKKKHRVLLVITIIVLIILTIGGKIYLDEKSFNDEMVKVVKSEEAKKVYEKTIKNNDPKAFTADGIIQSYEIDYDTIKHNPMGGIMFNLIINDNKNLYIHVTLDKESDGRLRNSSGGPSSELDDLLNEREATND
ncbi:hypothetical protein A5821_001326 [Enterococcus sp. 7F3_DIV0205]|uniref:DUF1310 family protein n=1 Tax=Candidatus Enterococcus palustris TaxID=1834189 RepID=A0AAQ3W8U3_9ENTE|nr:DUF1310 family protein [Enterococcus sp. 7F3_DIV0205]OTN85724.1 hypothetical protein A5821_001670 [Enterococcus sp. 7F3_DIV0205]